MNHDLVIKPLMLYEVKGLDGETDVFTGDEYFVEDGSVIFRRTGNNIREYIYGVSRIIVTPVGNDNDYI